MVRATFKLTTAEPKLKIFASFNLALIKNLKRNYKKNIYLKGLDGLRVAEKIGRIKKNYDFF